MIELMIAVAIIAILAAIGLPAYRDYVQRGKITEATTNLADLRVKLEQFYQDNRLYGTPDGANNCGKDAGGVVRVPMPAAPQVKYFTFTCTVEPARPPSPPVPGGAYAITATGVTGEGMAGFVYTINEANARSSTLTASGWTGNATCWAIKKGGAC